MKKQIFVLCPYGLVSGGPDAMHQLYFYLLQNHFDTRVVYVDISDRNLPIPIPYRAYLDSYCLLDDVPDSNQTIVIAPESLYFLLGNFPLSQKFIWWLSVDNIQRNLLKKAVYLAKKPFTETFYQKLFSGYYSGNKIKNCFVQKPYSFAKEGDVHHLCASFYAFDYVSKRTMRPVSLLIEPISLFFLKEGPFSSSSSCRQPVILYNPAKQSNFTRLVVSYCSRFRFIPLSGYSQQELLSLYRSSRVYMDFGSFPGAERIPKEAAYNGCAILTGKNGASAFYGDVPIPDKFKIASERRNLKMVKSTLSSLLNEFDFCIGSFSEYRATISMLEPNFVKSILEIFGDDSVTEKDQKCSK